jgi:glucosylceramidase
MIRDAMAMSDAPIRIIASPWSPPGWMKTNGEMNNGGELRPECRSSWAKYMAKYILAYRDEGIDIWGITVQNEPRAKQVWDSCEYTHEQQRDFVRDYLGPVLAAHGLEHVKILIWDHNRDEAYDCAKVILSDADAAKYVSGVAFHWYSGDEFANIERIHQEFPNQHLIFTEGCQEGGVKLGAWELGERYAHAIIGDLNHWTCAWIDWNLALDERGGPNHVGNYCNASIIANGVTDVVTYQNSFDYIRHFSRFIKPGAMRVRTQCSDTDLDVVGARNPDGSLVVVVLNRTERSVAFACGTDATRAMAEMPPRSIATYQFMSNGQGATPVTAP